MEPEQQTLHSNNKPPGIPRVSKLPVLTSKRLQASSQHVNGSPTSSNPTLEAGKRNSLSSPSRLGQPAARSSTVGAKQPAPVRPSVGHVGRSMKSPYATINRANDRRPLVKQHSQITQQEPLPSSDSKHPESGSHEHQEICNELEGIRPALTQDAADGPPLEATTNSTIRDIVASPAKRKPPRPSLSDRTIESLQNLPATPKERRHSNFFSPVDSPMGPPPRPASSLSRNGSSNGSRPNTSDGGLMKPTAINDSTTARAPPSVKASSRSSHNYSSSSFNHSCRSVSSASITKLQGSRTGLLQSPSPSLSSTRESPAQGSKPMAAPSARPQSKTMSARPSKSRPALSEAFRPAVREQSARNDSSDGVKVAPGRSAAVRGSPREANTSNASSAALREQIAAAKAAARLERANVNASKAAVNEASSGIGLSADPFGQAPKDAKHILRNRINAARTDGRLNITGMGLKDIPDEVLKMYGVKAMEQSKVNWAEIVDLTSFDVGDNEIEMLDDRVFPDKSIEDFEAEDDTEGNQFAGLKSLILHNNRLTTVPIGLRRLERLTFLSIGYNKLENSALEVITQITSLKKLIIGHNALSGSLPASIGNLRCLEQLDLQCNRLLSLPEALRELTSLRVLNLHKNQLTAVPMDALHAVPLKELHVSNNALISSLFPAGGKSGHPTLQSLSVDNNSLAALTFDDTLDLPALHGLNVTNNHLKSLPPLLFPNMISLMAGGNKLSELPKGFTSLQKLRFANFGNNEIRLIDNDVANMGSLETLDLSANPLRDKNFWTMSAADIKRNLKARQTPSQLRYTPQLQTHASSDSGVTSARPASSATAWVLKAKGVLDLTGAAYSDNINDELESFLRNNEVYQLRLQSNMLSAIPLSLHDAHYITVLNLCGNPLSLAYLNKELELPMLQELDLSRCGLSTLEPLLTRLSAPKLQRLDVSANKLLGSVPALRKSYPALTTLSASDNRFTSVRAEALHGLLVVNLASNNIEQLPAEVGLLWDEGLRSLEIGNNTFRMPNHRILEKGTEATMRWLRERIPASSEAVVVEER